MCRDLLKLVRQAGENREPLVSQLVNRLLQTSEKFRNLPQGSYRPLIISVDKPG